MPEGFSRTPPTPLILSSARVPNPVRGCLFIGPWSPKSTFVFQRRAVRLRTFSPVSSRAAEKQKGGRWVASRAIYRQLLTELLTELLAELIKTSTLCTPLRDMPRFTVMRLRRGFGWTLVQNWLADRSLFDS